MNRILILAAALALGSGLANAAPLALTHESGFTRQDSVILASRDDRKGGGCHSEGRDGHDGKGDCDNDGDDD